jgi:hypothetical protein
VCLRMLTSLRYTQYPLKTKLTCAGVVPFIAFLGKSSAIGCPDRCRLVADKAALLRNTIRDMLCIRT